MKPEAGYLLVGLILALFVGLAAFFLAKYREAAALGAQCGPLSSDDRLRVSLAARALEEAEKELVKAIYDGGNWREVRHPQVQDLLAGVHRLSNQAEKLLRES